VAGTCLPFQKRTGTVIVSPATSTIPCSTRKASATSVNSHKESEMAKYRIINEKGAYLALSPEVRPVDFGDTQSTNAYAIRAQLCQYCPQGTEVEGAHIVFGPPPRGALIAS
jgi:hypothetical protein